jgi:hypothetical protein
MGTTQWTHDEDVARQPQQVEVVVRRTASWWLARISLTVIAVVLFLGLIAQVTERTR